MATIPVYNPRIPFLGRIPGGFRPSLMIRVKGVIHQHNGKCQIDFLQTPATSVDQNIIFHVSVRPSENAVVRNHYEHGRWGAEERYGQFVIRKHEDFEIYILADHEFYKIAVNGHHIGVFRHRLPLNLVNYIRVGGEVQVSHILLEQDMQHPSSQGQIVVTQITTQQRPMPYGQSSIATQMTAVPSAPIPPPTYTPMNVHVMQSSHPPPLYQPTTSTIAKLGGIAIEKTNGAITIKRENKNIFKF